MSTCLHNSYLQTKCTLYKGSCHITYLLCYKTFVICNLYMTVHSFITYYREASIYMDTKSMSMSLVLSSLNRAKDVGRSKAEVAAEFVNKRVPGCKVTPYPTIKCSYNGTFLQLNVSGSLYTLDSYLGVLLMHV